MILFERNQPSPVDNENDSKIEVAAGFNNSDLYNAMMYPFTRMVINGAIWYQGKF